MLWPVFVFVVLGMVPRTLGTLGRCCSTEVHSQCVTYISHVMVGQEPGRASASFLALRLLSRSHCGLSRERSCLQPYAAGGCQDVGPRPRCLTGSWPFAGCWPFGLGSLPYGTPSWSKGVCMVWHLVPLDQQVRGQRRPSRPNPVAHLTLESRGPSLLEFCAEEASRQG